MKAFKRILLRFFFFFCFSLLLSCDNDERSDGRHPVFIKAENFYNEGKIDESYLLYEKYLQINPKSAKASYRLALISQDRGDYIKAIYYYEKYLELDPDSSDKEIIEKWIAASKKSLVKEIAKQDPILEKAITADSIKTPDAELSQLKEQNKELQKQIQTLKEQKSIAVDTSIAKTDTVQKIYIVQEGDNLYKISKKFYGSNKYYKLILEANNDKLKGSSSIKLGDKLIIPQLKGNQ